LAGTIAPDYDDTPVNLCEVPDPVTVFHMSYDPQEFPEVYATTVALYEESCPGKKAPPMPPLVNGELPPCVEARLDDLACLDRLKHQPGPVTTWRKTTGSEPRPGAESLRRGAPETPSHVPLPPAAALLLGALGLIGVVARRRG